MRGPLRSWWHDGELVELVRSRLSWYKVPQDVVWLDALPRNGAGKLVRRRLRARGWPQPSERLRCRLNFSNTDRSPLGLFTL
jgi:hypothetical protein